MSAADDQSIVRSMNVLPEYQETFLKDLLANIYQVQLDDQTGDPLLGPESGQPVVSGIAADSPLYGTPVLDEAGNIKCTRLTPRQGELAVSTSEVSLSQWSKGAFVALT